MPVGAGYRFAVLGDNDAVVEDLVARVHSLARSEVGRLYLEPAPHREGWALSGDDVVGQLAWNDQAGDGKPYSVIIDGRTLSWAELGSAPSRMRAGGSACSSKTRSTTPAATPTSSSCTVA